MNHTLSIRWEYSILVKPMIWAHPCQYVIPIWWGICENTLSTGEGEVYYGIQAKGWRKTLRASQGVIPVKYTYKDMALILRNSSLSSLPVGEMREVNK